MSSCRCERSHQGTALPLKNCSIVYFWFLHLAIPASSLCHEGNNQGLWGASLLGLLLKPAYPWCSLVSGIFVLASNSQMSGNFPCPQNITAGMKGGPETCFLKSNTTKNPKGNPMRETWYPESGVVPCCINHTPMYLLNLLFNGKKSKVNKQIAQSIYTCGCSCLKLACRGP